MDTLGKLGSVALELSETLRKETEETLLTAVMQQERTEHLLEKHGLTNFNYRSMVHNDAHSKPTGGRNL